MKCRLNPNNKTISEPIATNNPLRKRFYSYNLDQLSTITFHKKFVSSY